MSICGLLLWLRRGPGHERLLAAMIGLVTLVCLAFYVFWPTVDRNYGGMASGFRWVFWMAPLWLAAMLPCADAAAGRRGWREPSRSCCWPFPPCRPATPPGTRGRIPG